MKVEFWVIGNTAFDYLKEGTTIYEKRLQHFLPFEYNIIPDVKNAKSLPTEQLKEKEGEVILKKLDKGDWLLLLDEQGKEFSSVAFANYLDNLLQQNHKRIVLLVGGAYGFSPDIYARANGKISLSKMTFSHQMVRLFVLEQLYRAMSILRNLPYHHE